jgi:NitT/TauT family transport system ATP-binding protein
MIEIEKLTYRYGNGPLIFEDFTWRVAPRETWAIIGPSGCGKTTLLYLLAGLFKPVAGTIRIDGRSIRRPRPRSGLVLQDHGLLPWATVRQNAVLGLTIRSFYGADGRHAPADESLDDEETARRVDAWLERLEIAELQDKFPSQLSRGQRQRTAIARTLVTRPDLLLLDEPFSALDAPTREGLQKVIIDLHEETALVVIVVTHDIEVAVTMGRKILILGKGTHSAPRMVANPLAGGIGHRQQAAFRDTCDKLRHILGEHA